MVAIQIEQGNTSCEKQEKPIEEVISFVKIDLWDFPCFVMSFHILACTKDCHPRLRKPHGRKNLSRTRKNI